MRAFRLYRVIDGDVYWFDLAVNGVWTLSELLRRVHEETEQMYESFVYGDS